LDNFDDKYIQTLGTKVSKKELASPSPDGTGDLKIDMTIWDIMGQKGFRELLKEAYFYGARGILAVCDVTRRKTLEDLDDWIEGVYSVTGKIPIEFLGNKIDLKDQQQISEDEMIQAARAYDSPFHFTSAKACLVGDVAVGKTSLIRRFVQDEFDDRYIATVGTKVTKKTVDVTWKGAPAMLDMMVWDIMGEKGFRALLRDAYFEGSHGVI